MISSVVFVQSIIPLRRRLQQRKSLRAGWMTLSAGLGITTLLLLAGRLTPLLPQLQLLLIGLSFTAFLVAMGQLIAWLRPPSLTVLARTGDAALGLEERLTTALELLTGQVDTAPQLRQAQLTDTLAHLRRAPIGDALPLAASPRWTTIVSSVLLALAISLAALAILPNPQDVILQQRHQLDELLKTEIADLQQLQTDLLTEPDPVLAEQIEPITGALAELLQKLESARAERSAGEAMAALSKAKETLTRLDQQRQAQAESLNTLADALAQTDSQLAQQTADALRSGDAQQAADTLVRAAQSLANAGQTAQADGVAQALSQAAQSVAASNPALAQSLQQAATALQSGDSQSAQQALQQAAQQLAQAGASAQALAQTAQALANIQQARQALAQQVGSGNNGGQQANRGGTGQNGNGAGAGGQGVDSGGSGSGRGEPGAGRDGLYSAQGTNGIIPTANGPNQNRTGDYSSVYAPRHLGGEGGDFVVPNPQNPAGGIDVGEVPGSPNRDSGAATVPYTAVYRDYADRARTALESDYIPLGMKDYVRQYFGALEPK